MSARSFAADVAVLIGPEEAARLLARHRLSGARHHSRVALAAELLGQMPRPDAARALQARLGVSRATAYRLLDLARPSQNRAFSETNGGHDVAINTERQT